MRNTLIPTSDFEGLINRFLAPWNGADFAESRMDFAPRADIEETKTHYLMTMDLPGLTKEDVKIELHNNTLTISGERKQEATKNEGGTRYSERRFGSFRRAFTLPDSVESKGVEASYNNGVLEIAVPKTEKSQPQQIKIN